MTVNDVPYLIFVKFNGESMEGFVVQYSYEGINSFDLTDSD